MMIINQKRLILKLGTRNGKDGDYLLEGCAPTWGVAFFVLLVTIFKKGRKYFLWSNILQ